MMIVYKECNNEYHEYCCNCHIFSDLTYDR